MAKSESVDIIAEGMRPGMSAALGGLAKKLRPVKNKLKGTLDKLKKLLGLAVVSAQPAAPPVRPAVPQEQFEQTQEGLFKEFELNYNNDRYDRALEAIDRSIALDPESEKGKEIMKFREALVDEVNTLLGSIGEKPAFGKKTESQ